MTKRILTYLCVIAMLLAFFTACAAEDAPVDSQPQVNEPQLVVAANPVFVYDDNTTAVAYNELNKAMTADSQASSLAAITASPWRWVYGGNGAWTDRAVYGFGRWKNGAGAQAKGAFAYTYNAAGSQSLGVYSTAKNDLATYQGETLPEAGLLLSVTGKQEEALHYTVQQDGKLTIQAGSFTAIEQVAGIKTGFLAEDGTPRRASLRITANSVQLWSGTLCNTTASTDGRPVTQLAHPAITDIPVKAGDVIVISFKLDAQANSDLDVTAPTVNEEDNWQIVTKPSRVPVTSADKEVVTNDGSIPVISDFDFTFTLVRDPDRYTAITADFASELMDRLNTEIVVAKRGQSATHEIVVGPYDARPESVRIYNEIKNARADNGADFVLRLVGTKLYIVGVNDDALQAALDYFLNTFIKDDKGVIRANYSYYYKPEHAVYTLPGGNIAGYTIRTERYPSLIVQRAAEAFQQEILDKCGYILPIKAMNLEGTDAGDREIRIGPMNGAVNVQRVYDTRFTSANWQNYYTSFETDGMLDADYGYYKVGFAGKSLTIQGGSNYAVNAGTVKLLAELAQKKTLTTAYTLSGTYSSYYDYQNKAGYGTVDFSLTGGFGLTYMDNFDYEGTDEEKVKLIESKWQVSKDNSAGGDKDEHDMYQYRPGIYGKNWWVDADAAGNNYLFQVTKKRVAAYGDPDDHGWEAGRLIAANKWGFRFGIWESRMVMGTRNGACSAAWANTLSPYTRDQANWECDVYENYGRDVFVPCFHAFTSDPDGRDTRNFLYGKPNLQTPCWLEPNEGEHFYDTFHHVTVDWTYDYVRVYFDGQLASEMMLDDNHPSAESFRNGLTIKFANGIGKDSYCKKMPPPNGVNNSFAYNPYYWMGLYGGDVKDFFEVQLVDFARVYQVSNDTIDYVPAENDMRFIPTFGKVK
ncbi:MAG: glycosyl hydrolase family protein [Ruminococcaceae bacterium]|nr:glycosyl hydrolase family protein [Oscillospiraceae bacterium]